MNHVSGYTEKELLQLSTEGDEKAFAEIFHRYKFKLYGFIYRLTQSQEMAEDIVQETFLLNNSIIGFFAVCRIYCTTKYALALASIKVGLEDGKLDSVFIDLSGTPICLCFRL